MSAHESPSAPRRTVDINRLGVAALQKLGIDARFLQLGYTPRWDHWHGEQDTERACRRRLSGRRHATAAHRARALRLAIWPGVVPSCICPRRWFPIRRTRTLPVRCAQVGDAAPLQAADEHPSQRARLLRVAAGDRGDHQRLRAAKRAFARLRAARSGRALLQRVVRQSRRGARARCWTTRSGSAQMRIVGI